MRILRPIVAALSALALIPIVAAPTQAAADDLYTTEGTHFVNGREWRTACEPYSQTRRCRTEIKATVITYEGGRFITKHDWTFNNLTYAASSRSLWKTNPLGAYGVVKGTASWAGPDHRIWSTECDNATTGWGGCRSYTRSSVIESYRTAAGATAYRTVDKWVFNNIVRFTSAATTPVAPKPVDPLAAVSDSRLRECLRDAVAEFGSLAKVESLVCDAMGISSLKGFPSMPGLLDLSLMDNRLTSFHGLPALPALEFLSVSGNAITNLGSLPSLQRLVWLDVSANSLSSVRDLPALPELEAIDLWSNNFSGVFDLAALPRTVWSVDLTDNALTDVTGAGANLEMLFLGFNNLNDVTAVAEAANLVVLDLMDNRITSVAGLRDLQFLEMLFLEGNEVTDLETLQPLVDRECYIDIWPGSTTGVEVRVSGGSGAQRFEELVAQRQDR